MTTVYSIVPKAFIVAFRRSTMSISSTIGRATFALALIAVCVMGAALLMGASAQPSQFDSKGALIQPKGYREWTFVGTPITPNSLNQPAAAFPEFHNVYIHPEDFAHYKQTGMFRDGTILIKELVGVGATQAASGNGFFQGDYVGLEAAVKDSKRFSNEPGYWAYFTFSHESPPYPSKAKRQPTGACNACHQANATEDWVFTQYYPVLRAAKPK
jgi:hypothetical protein